MMHSDLKRGSIATIEPDLGHRSILRWFARLMARRRRAATRARLDYLDDHMLRDVGLRRDKFTGKVERHTQFHDGPIFR